MNLSVNIGYRVIDDLMRVIAFKSFVRLQRIAIECGACLNVLANLRMDRMFLAIRNYGCAYFAVLAILTTFQYAHDGSLVFAAGPSDAPCAFRNMHVAGFTADESLIGFDMAGELLKRSMMESEANAVHHVPSRLLGDSQVAGDFVAADTVLAGHQEPHGRQPLFKRDRRVLENRSGLEREGLSVTGFMLGVALPHASFGQPSDLLSAAPRTFHFAIRPAKFDHKRLALLEIGEVQDGFLKSLRCVAHTLSMA